MERFNEVEKPFARSLGGGAVPFNFTLDEGGGIRNYNPATDTYNFGPVNHFAPQD